VANRKVTRPFQQVRKTRLLHARTLDRDSSVRENARNQNGVGDLLSNNGGGSIASGVDAKRAVLHLDPIK
jgi:hypothetical protein